MQFSKTARRSGNPNFMCCHVKSVQYVTEPFNPPPTMSRTVLEELIGKVKWLKQSREQECLQAQAVAKNSKAPLLVEFCNSRNVSSTRCVALSEPKCITRRGKIFTINKVINGKLIVD